MKEPTLNPESDLFDQWLKIFQWLGYLSIVMALIFTASDDVMTRTGVILEVSLLAVFTTWYTVLFNIDRSVIYERVPASLVPLLPGMMIVVVLIWINPSNGWLLSAFFPLIYTRVPMGYAVTMTGLTALSMIVFIVFDTKSLPLGIVISTGVTAAFAIILGFFISALVEQGARLRTSLEELQSTQEALKQSEREAGKLAERQRLADEIHDTLAQGFISIITQLEAAEANLPEKAGMDHLLLARQTARESLEESRRLVWSLRPDLTENQGLHERLKRYLERWQEKTGITSTFAFNGSPLFVDPQHESVLIRSAREALTNIEKHSKATQVTVTLSYMGDMIALDIHDNGVGYAERQLDSKDGGYGLVSIRKSIEDLEGTLSIDGDPEDGTMVGILIPLSAKENLL